MRFAALLTAAVLLVPPTVSAARAPAVYDPLVGQLVAQVDWQRVEGHILELTAFPTRYSYSPHCAAAADSLADPIGEAAGAGVEARTARLLRRAAGFAAPPSPTRSS